MNLKKWFGVLALALVLPACGDTKEEPVDDGPSFPVLGDDANARAFLSELDGQPSRLHITVDSTTDEPPTSCEESLTDGCFDNTLILPVEVLSNLQEGQVLSLDQFTYDSGVSCNNDLPLIISEAEATVLELSQERISIKVEGMGEETWRSPEGDVPFSMTFTSVWCTDPTPWVP
jgi:hypothetical protein